MAADIDHQETPAAHDLLGAVVTGLLGQSRRTDSLAVQNGHWRTAAPSRSLSRQGPEPVVDHFEDSLEGPRPKATVDGTLGRKVLGKAGPMTTRLYEAKDGVEDLSQTGAGPTGPLGFGEKRFEYTPLVVGKISVVAGAFLRLDGRCRGEMSDSDQGQCQRQCAISGSFLDVLNHAQLQTYMIRVFGRALRVFGPEYGVGWYYSKKY